jgi:hypothetical protein
MKARLEPMLPRAPGVRVLSKESPGRVEEPGASLQPLVALLTAILARTDRLWLHPPRQHFAPQSRVAFRDQGSDGQGLPAAVQSPQSTRAQASQPTMHSGGMRMALAHARNRLAQAFCRPVRSGVDRAGRLNHLPCVALERRDLDRQNAEAFPARLAAAQRHRRLAILDAAAARPTRSTRDPAGKVDQRADRSAMRTKNLRANRFAFDSRGRQSIIRDGDGNGDRLLSGSPRGTGAFTPVPHFLQKAETLLPQPPLRKPLVQQPPAHEHELFYLRLAES